MIWTGWREICTCEEACKGRWRAAKGKRMSNIEEE